MLLWAWATVSLSTHPECLKAPFTSIWSFETFTSSEFAQLMLQQLRQVYTKSCNYKIANNLDHVQTSRCVHIHHVQTRHCVHIHYVQTSTFFLFKEVCSGNLALLAYLASFLATVLFLLTLALVLLLRRRKKKRAANQIKEEDKNPVYGIYYFADGELIDQSRSEAVDNNENYGS